VDLSGSGDEAAGGKLYDCVDTRRQGTVPPEKLERYLNGNRRVIQRLAGPLFRAGDFYARLSTFLARFDPLISRAEFVCFYLEFQDKPQEQPENSAEAGLKELFCLFDADGSGYVGERELGDVMRALGLPAGQRDVEGIMSHVDKSGTLINAMLTLIIAILTLINAILTLINAILGDGQMSFEEFKLAMEKSQAEAKRAEGRHLSGSGSRSPPGPALPKRRGSKAPELSDQELFELSEAFDTFDIDGNGSITLDEMRLAMRNFGIRASARQVRQLVEELDLNGDERISFEEFVAGVSPYVAP